MLLRFMTQIGVGHVWELGECVSSLEGVLVRVFCREDIRKNRSTSCLSDPKRS